jgi:tetratricopeptide (TPR) repeat protein
VEELDDALRRGEQETRPFTPPLPTSRTRPLFSRSPDLSSSHRSRAGAVLALALVALAGLAVAGIALLGGGSGGGSGAKKEAKAAKSAGGSGAPADSGAATASPPAASEDAAAAPASPAGSSPSSTDGATLNAQGFELINQGRPAEAVPILRRAVDSFPDGSTDLNYAYALYNLGNALRLSGHPEEAIPVLEQRLQIPNQRSTVAAELARARAEAG